MINNLPTAVRYIKNGRGGQWWPQALASAQIHCGWSRIAGDVLLAGDLVQIEKLSQDIRGDTQDLNALSCALSRPSQYIWVTIQDGCLWWCTVRDGITINPTCESSKQGHFWLTCDRPWNCYSVGGRHLVTSNLPGVIVMTEGFRRTICEPKGASEILRVINDEVDHDAAVAATAKSAYEDAIAVLIARLLPRDFELLIDLILSRDGWVRLSRLGGPMEGIDLEVENASADEIACVQVKSSAEQTDFDDYVGRFCRQREHYARMIFCVHTLRGAIQVPANEPVQLWDRARIARLVVRHGLGNWLAARV